MSFWQTDSSGNSYITNDGKAANTFGQTVTVANGSGQLNNGTWNGLQAVVYPPSSKSSTGN
jgi:hypothetical protein